jgi:type III restriction enzyme
LVKTPRVVVRDDALPNAQSYRSKLYHLYRDPEVQEDLNRRGAEPHEPLPKLVQDAYTLLGADWRAGIAETGRKQGHHSPPVMLTVCNRVETAARIEHYLNHGDAHWPELKVTGARRCGSIPRCWRRQRSVRRPAVRECVQGSPAHRC